MLLQYTTDRLILQILDESAAPLVLDFYLKNHHDFDRYDMSRPDEFFTIDYQRKLLASEQRLFLCSKGVRFYIFLKEQPEAIIGSISFAYLSEENGHKSSIGYKLDSAFRHLGYAYEAASFLIPIVMKHYSIRRLEADIMPANQSSIRLIERLGFSYEGIARGAHEVNGTEEDHLRYSLLSADL